MEMTQHSVFIHALRLYAHHGAMPQEQLTGAYFIIDVEVDVDFTHAGESDELDGTLNYASVHEWIKQEMTTPSRLLEHVATRIAKRILQECTLAQNVRLSLTKENPPMGADCRGAGVRLTMNR